MLTYYRNVFGHNHMFLVFCACLVYLFFADKERRKTIVLPSVLLILVIFNPVLYYYVWNKLLVRVYWRMFWILPVIPVLAYTMVHLVFSLKERAGAIFALTACLLLVMHGGSNVYDGEETSFQTATNTYKLPQEVLAVCDQLTELEKEPRAVMDGTLYCGVRQYTTKVKMMYGRDANGYIKKIKGKRRRTVRQLSKDKPNLKKVRKYMIKLDYPYYARCNDKDELNGFTTVDFINAGFEVAAEVGNYTIYRVVKQE